MLKAAILTASMLISGPTYATSGLASFYSDRHHGKTTASGVPYNKNALTAAHKTLPFGTKVHVRRLDTDLEVTVTINDKGPYVKGRIIDLSEAAARRLNMLEAGVARVEIEVVGQMKK